MKSPDRKGRWQIGYRTEKNVHCHIVQGEKEGKGATGGFNESRGKSMKTEIKGHATLV